MKIIVLTEDNVQDYEEFIPEDVAENIGRTYYRGIIAEDEKPLGGMIWIIKNARSEDKKESHIDWLVFSDDSVGDALFEKYEEMASYEDVTKTTFELPARKGKEYKAFLKEKGFSVKLMEGDIIVAKLSEIAEIGFLKKIRPNDDIKPLRSVTQRGFNIAIRRMSTMGYHGLCEDIEYLPRMFFENDISCYSEQEGIINGLFLCHKKPSGRLVVEMMSAVGKDYVKTLPYLIGRSYLNAIEIYPPETEVMIDRHNYASLALGEKLFPTSFGIPIYIGSRDENN